MNRGAALTTDEVLSETDLRGRTGVVTGASSGLGAETARALAAAGAHIVLAGRDPVSTTRTTDEIRVRHEGSSVRSARWICVLSAACESSRPNSRPSRAGWTSWSTMRASWAPR